MIFCSLTTGIPSDLSAEINELIDIVLAKRLQDDNAVTLEPRVNNPARSIIKNIHQIHTSSSKG